MPTNDDKPSVSVFAKFIKDPEEERHEPERTQTSSADFVSQWVRETSAKTFLMNILQNGPVPTTVILERGKARGFSKKQLKHAKEQTGVIAFKEKGKFGAGRWFWTTTKLTSEQIAAVKHNDYLTHRLRNLSRTMGYRLQPIGKGPSANEKDE
jgi:hypothetical protein